MATTSSGVGVAAVGAAALACALGAGAVWANARQPSASEASAKTNRRVEGRCGVMGRFIGLRVKADVAGQSLRTGAQGQGHVSPDSSRRREDFHLTVMLSRAASGALCASS